jgi:hypothetical protein
MRALEPTGERILAALRERHAAISGDMGERFVAELEQHARSRVVGMSA